MNFKNDFLAALQGGKDYDDLMELVRCYRKQGMSIDAAYDGLHAIWEEYGFDNEVAKEGTLQDTLEAVMEKVWYGQSI